MRSTARIAFPSARALMTVVYSSAVSLLLMRVVVPHKLLLVYYYFCATVKEMETSAASKYKPKRQVVGQDDNVGVKITARVATDTNLPIRWKELEDGTFVLQWLAANDWIEVPIVK
jgi:hypothetical protein